MDGKRIQNYWSNEMQAMLDTYKQFQILIPAENRNGAAHNGEDGRYVENINTRISEEIFTKRFGSFNGIYFETSSKNRIEK